MLKTARMGLLTMLLTVVLAACGQTTTTTTSTTTTNVTSVTAAPTDAPAPITAMPMDTTASAVTTTSGTGATGGALPAAKPDTGVTAELRGSGASFPNAIYQRWVEDYKAVVPGVTIAYQSVGSGQGIKDYTGNITDFGGTDAFLNEEQLGAAAGTLHIPMVAGAVVATYNLPGITTLQFSPDTLANIFLGTITNWNDPKIAADNPGVQLPDQNVTVVYRADGSGTTSIFTNYLSSISPEFKDKVGAGTTVQWPAGQGEQKNDGVASAVKANEGAIGYVELIYALGNQLPAPAIKNAAGTFVQPSLDTVTEAAAGFASNLPDDLRINIVNPPTGTNAYPISGFTWLILKQEQTDQAKAKALTDFIYWCLTTGDAQATSLRFSPLPAEVKERAVQKLEQITVNGQPVFKRPS